MASNLSYGSGPTAQQPQPPHAQYPQAQYPQAQYPQAQYPQAQYPRAQPAQPSRPQAEQPEPLGDQGIWPLIRQSAARLSRNEDAFIEQLHYDVARLIQDGAGTPAPGMRAFCERMARSLLWVALTDQPPAVVVDALRQAGAQNWAEGFAEPLYGSFVHALIQTVHYLSESDWSASTSSAWITFFMWIKPHLLAGAQYAAASHAATQQAAERQAAAQRDVAEREAARVAALARNAQVVADVNLESVGNLLDDDEDDEDPGYGQIMLGMTRPRRQ